jgi:hypothetical protein
MVFKPVRRRDPAQGGFDSHAATFPQIQALVRR